jgi:hypothetical protein
MTSVQPSFETFQRELVQLRNEVADKDNQVEMLQESVGDLVLALDNIGWKPLGDVASMNTGPDLEKIRGLVDRCRTVFTGNPTAERGIQIRRGYVWGSGVEMKSGGRGTGLVTLTDTNQRSLFSQRARNELEFAAATDGNLFMILDSATKKVVRVPVSEIGGYATDPDDVETITHYKRVWTRVTTGPDGQKIETPSVAWYPAHDATVAQKKTRFSTANSDPQAQTIKPKATQAMIQISFNTQLHWHFGLPDLFNVLWWIEGYRVYIEAGFSVTKALAKFAVKVTSPTAKGANRAAAAIAAPQDGGISTTRGYGQAAMASGGSDISAISKSGAEFDFASGEALAALIAAGLGIDVDDLLAKTQQSGDNQISVPTVKAMSARQLEWDDFLSAIARYMGITKPNIVFPPVRAVAVHRAIQAVVLAASTNGLWPDEVRALILQMLQEYGIESNGKGVPEDGAWAKFTTGIDAQANIEAQAQAAKDAADAAAQDQPAEGDPEHPGTKPLNTPKGATKTAGKRTPAGPLADGDNSQRKSAK